MDIYEIKQFVLPYYYFRPWHNERHIFDMLKNFTQYQRDANIKLTVEEKENLEVAILFHDIVYDPRRNDNEEVSIQLMYNYFEIEKFKLLPEKRLNEIAKLILATTKNHLPATGNGKIIVDLDMAILKTKNVSELIEYEYGIFKEYQWVDVNTYIQKRCEFLEKNIADHNRWLIDYVKSRPYKIGIYPGSFNPFHIGHHDILKQAEKVFDKVIIARGINPDKSNKQYPLPSNLVTCLDKKFKWNDAHQVVEYSGLVTELFERDNNDNIDYFLIRGLRNEADVAQEENFRKVVHDIDRSIKFSYFFSEKSHISSSMIRGLMKFSPSIAGGYIIK